MREERGAETAPVWEERGAETATVEALGSNDSRFETSSKSGKGKTRVAHWFECCYSAFFDFQLPDPSESRPK